MKHIFIGQCLADAAFLPMLSLNDPVERSRCGYGEGSPDEVGALIPDPEAPDAVAILEGVMLARIPAFLDSLPDRLRYIVHSLYWLKQTQSAVAAELGITQSAVAHGLARAHQLGRRFFGLDD
jgi:DNA-directed RNA polymerase specialized sigma24 family protein